MSTEYQTTTESNSAYSTEKQREPAIAEDDITMQLRAFGTLPLVRTLRLAGSRCEVFKWSDTPRP